MISTNGLIVVSLLLCCSLCTLQPAAAQTVSAGGLVTGVHNVFLQTDDEQTATHGGGGEEEGARKKRSRLVVVVVVDTGLSQVRRYAGH